MNLSYYPAKFHTKRVSRFLQTSKSMSGGPYYLKYLVSATIVLFWCNLYINAALLVHTVLYMPLVLLCFCLFWFFLRLWTVVVWNKRNHYFYWMKASCTFKKSQERKKWNIVNILCSSMEQFLVCSHSSLLGNFVKKRFLKAKLRCILIITL